VLGHVLEYQENILNEEEQEAKEATIEFKKDTLDPSRPIVAWEKALNMRKRNELNRKTRMINKGRDMQCINEII
jgi:predicted pyridoxine 5'-phosphate oxidase superfamily flavin-nucleotide-binding protein